MSNDEIRTLVMSHESAANIRRAARLRGGMSTMREDAFEKACRGITTLEEVNRKTRVDEPLEEEAPAAFPAEPAAV